MNRTNFTLLIALYLLFVVAPGYAQQKQMPTACNDAMKLSRADFIYDEQGKLFYLITNTDDKLFVHIRANDETAQKKLINNGLAIEIKNGGGKKEKLQIEYPLPKEERMQPIILLADNSHNERNNFNLVKSQVVNQINRMRITDLADKKNSVVVAAANNSDINGCMTISGNGDLHYLLVVSLHRLGVDLSENSLIDIKMASGNTGTPNASFKQQGGKSGMNSGGRGGMNGRGKGGGMGRGRYGAGAGNKGQKTGEKQALSTPVNIRIKNFRL
ncbi:hypothetical protein OU798_07830 [Prolixibacteraceae bacterium Z1-6]|uniref:Auto-transporter adhesin head GIN domain-containing protein n=1 Tax=Draconibacterium aestuarii TaxID=2998507 RepID=A0A9X3FCT8_9BACT|nr:hypothetical protein [Prolixibacteraceae bacterium Z1-6]